MGRKKFLLVLIGFDTVLRLLIANFERFLSLPSFCFVSLGKRGSEVFVASAFHLVIILKKL